MELPEQKKTEQRKTIPVLKKLKAIVEVSWGIGNLVKAIPLLNAMRVHDVEVDLLWMPDFYGAAISLVDNALLCNKIYREKDLAEIEKRILGGEYAFGISCYLSRQLVNNSKIAKKIPIYYSTAGLEEQEDIANIRLFLKALCDITGKALDITVPRQLLMNVEICDDYEKYRDYIIICPGSKKGWEHKLYPNWRAVIDALVASGEKVAILADAQDLARNEWMVAEGADYDVIQVGLREAFYIAIKCKLMISTDTGLAHLRSLDGRIQIMLFGPTFVKKNVPVSDRCVVITNTDMECMPCQGTTKFGACKKNECMNIEATTVVNIAKKLLAGEKIVSEEGAKNVQAQNTPDNDEINVNKNYIEFGGK